MYLFVPPEIHVFRSKRHPTPCAFALGVERVQLPPGGFKRTIGFPSLQSWDDHVIDSCLFGSGAWFNHKKMRCDVTGQEQLLRETP